MPTLRDLSTLGIIVFPASSRGRFSACPLFVPTYFSVVQVCILKTEKLCGQ